MFRPRLTQLIWIIYCHSPKDEDQTFFQGNVWYKGIEKKKKKSTKIIKMVSIEIEQIAIIFVPG